MNLGVEQPVEKKRKKSSYPEVVSPPSFFSLPEDITENCLARTPWSCHPKLLTVSKYFRSFLSSTDLYEVRSRLGITEKCLYVSLYDYNFPGTLQLLKLWVNPNRNLIRKTTSGQLLVTIPSSNFHIAGNPTVVGSEIYTCGGYRRHSSSVRVLDCRSHTWRDAPSMNVPRENPASCLYDGKIYVMGGLEEKDEVSSYAEVLDIKTLTWECLPSPGDTLHHSIDKIVGFEGKIHLSYRNTLYTSYDPKQCKWEKENATFDNASYSFEKHGRGYNLMWRDLNSGDSKQVKGLESLGNRYKRHGGSYDTTTKVASCGEKVYIMWEMYRKKKDIVEIWCAEISIEMRGGDGIWGNVEWLNIVHTIPKQCRLVHCLVVSI